MKTLALEISAEQTPRFCCNDRDRIEKVTYHLPVAYPKHEYESTDRSLDTMFT